MTVLPSPIPHPLDYSPWDLPGWAYEALDWVVGVEWPEGNERAVWDLADQWYAVAGALAGPRADAIAAATEVRGGYGAAGAVPEAFEAAWRRLADGDDAPLTVLLAVSTDLGRLVEECGCDIEAAKLEVWIELGILVVELLALAVAAALTAGAASPAAGAAVTASRLVIQQIFRRLMAQLAKKALRQGLKEAGERAAKEVARDGMRGLGKRAVKGGLFEAGQEGGVNLATQAYQNSTGRRHGLDLADLGASALGGLAGGAVAPLAGLGRHATGRGARVGEHLGREMTGEVLAEGAAGLATGQGALSPEDAARAAVSGVGSSATAQADAALHARLDGRLHSLADATQVSAAFPVPPSPVPAGAEQASPAGDAPGRSAADASVPGPATSFGPTVVAGDGSGTAAETPSPRDPQVPPDPGRAAAAVGPVDGPAGADAVTPPAPPAPGVDHVTGAAPASIVAESTPSSPTLSSVAADQVTSPLTAGRAAEVVPTNAAVTAPPGPDSGQGNPPASVTTAGGAPTATATASPTADPSPGRTTSGASTAGVPPGPAPGGSVGPAPTPGLPIHGSTPDTAQAARERPPGVADRDGRRQGDRRFPLLEALAPGPVDPPAPDPTPPTPDPDDEPPRPRTPRWYAAKWAAEREALDRRRYQGYFEAQRHWFEDRRRRDDAGFRREVAREHEARAQRAARRANHLQREGRLELANWYQQIASTEQADSYRELDLASEIIDGRVFPTDVVIGDPADFSRINDDVAELAAGGVETGDRSALTGDDDPPPIDRSRRYGQFGGLRPPLALHQTDLERQMPRQPDGSVVRTPDPRQGGWFALANDGGPQADPTRGINCLDCTLSLFETWVHGRPRVAAPRTFDGYLQGDIRRPVNGEAGGPGRVEEVTGGRFQKLFAVADGVPPGPADLRQSVERGYRNLHDQLVLGGHGSYAFLITEWENGGSHAWVALNQNGTVLYLDPQAGTVHERPLYAHAGRRHPDNVVGIDALILGGDGHPMPLAGLARGRFSALPDLPEHPPAPDDEQGYGDPYLNRLHLLDGPGSAERAGPASRDPDRQPEPGTPPGEAPQHASDQSPPQGTASRVRELLAGGMDLDGVLRAGLTPAEISAHADASVLRRLVPQLDAPGAADVARLLRDPRVVRMLDETWRDPPGEQHALAETLLRQLTHRPDLARMILATPELADSLTARPLTLHHLAARPQALAVLTAVVGDVADRGVDSLPSDGPRPAPTRLTGAQIALSRRMSAFRQPAYQPGFELSRRDDEEYRTGFLARLYADAEEAQQELNLLASDLAEGRGRAGWRKAPKGNQRVLDKLVEYENDASKLKDLAAAKIEFRHLDDVYQALEDLAGRPSIVVLNIKDRFMRPQLSGYRDILLSLRMSNGHIAELRFHLAAVDGVAEWEHALYEVRRDIEAMAEADGRPLTLRERVIRHGLLQRAQEAFRAATDAGRED
ncbi:toxin glutamine deamidase domain-containing protein [Micromonospora sp. NPDC049081]|uniref:toxin glutamine deamidase domain-containing protein n=1 Tax=Micromonospora sp. NPDC049081 TaxID=3155150 RepID=UPI0033EB0E10